MLRGPLVQTAALVTPSRYPTAAAYELPLTPPSSMPRRVNLVKWCRNAGADGSRLGIRVIIATTSCPYCLQIDA